MFWATLQVVTKYVVLLVVPMVFVELNVNSPFPTITGLDDTPPIVDEDGIFGITKSIRLYMSLIGTMVNQTTEMLSGSLLAVKACKWRC